MLGLFFFKQLFTTAPSTISRPVTSTEVLVFYHPAPYRSNFIYLFLRNQHTPWNETQEENREKSQIYAGGKTADVFKITCTGRGDTGTVRSGFSSTI